jgi:DNA-binding SARP family transcriptional activator
VPSVRPAAASLRVQPLRVALLGSFELRADGKPVRLPMSAQRLVAFLGLHERPARRPYVAGVLWPETTDERAFANLRSAVWRVRHPAPGLVDVRGQRLALGPSVELDIREAITLAHSLLVEEGVPDRLDTARFGADLLPDWYDDWVVAERERYTQLRLHALERVAELSLDAGRLGVALEATLAALAGDPLRESAHRLLIRIHLAEGNAAEALRHYGSCRRLFHDRVGVAPSAHLDALVRGLVEGELAV